MMTEPGAVVRMQVDRHVVDVDADALRAQGPEHLATVGLQPSELETNDVQMIGVLSARSHAEGLQPCQLREGVVVSPGDGAPPGDKGREPLEL